MVKGIGWHADGLQGAGAAGRKRIKAALKQRVLRTATVRVARLLGGFGK